MSRRTNTRAQSPPKRACPARQKDSPAIEDAGRLELARLFHDEFGQYLAVFKMGLEGLLAALVRGEDQTALRTRITTLLRQIEQRATDTSQLTRDLRCASPGHTPTIAAIIDAQARAFQSRTGIACQTIGLPGAPHVDANTTGIVCRILQEALSNVARHSAADRVLLETSTFAGQFCLSVTDNGVGIQPDKIDDAAFGLMGMRERAQLLGGRIEIRSSPARGTVIRILIPVKKGMSYD